jgi:hypothetical protein
MEELLGCSLIMDLIYDYSTTISGKFNLSNLNRASRKLLSSKNELIFYRKLSQMNRDFHPYYKSFFNKTFLKNPNLFPYSLTINDSGVLYYPSAYSNPNTFMNIAATCWKLYPYTIVEIWMHYITNPDEQLLFGPPEWHNHQFIMHHTHGDIWRVYVPNWFLHDYHGRLRYHLRSHIYTADVIHNHGYVQNGYRNSQFLHIDRNSIKPFASIHVPFLPL